MTGYADRAVPRMSADIARPITARSLDEIDAAQAPAVLALGDAVYAPELRYKAAVEMLALRRGVTRMLVDNWEHGLQSATRALRAGEDEETIVVALFHDIFDHVEFGATDHGTMIANMMLPYVSDENAWLLKMHVAVLNRHRHYLPDDQRNAGDRYKGHPAYEKTVRFCCDYDAPSFDPDYPSLPIAVFEPMAMRLFAKTPNMRTLW